MIRFEDVSKVYEGQKRAALKDVTLEIEKGEFVFLVGTSGSGKSTFLRLILREYRPTKGHIYVAGKDLTRLPGWQIPGLRRQIGTVFQDFRLLPHPDRRRAHGQPRPCHQRGDHEAARPHQPHQRDHGRHGHP